MEVGVSDSMAFDDDQKVALHVISGGQNDVVF